MKFCTEGGVHNFPTSSPTPILVTMGSGGWGIAVGGRISHFSIDSHCCPQNTLALTYMILFTEVGEAGSEQGVTYMILFTEVGEVEVCNFDACTRRHCVVEQS